MGGPIPTVTDESLPFESPIPGTFSSVPSFTSQSPVRTDSLRVRTQEGVGGSQTWVYLTQDDVRSGHDCGVHGNVGRLRREGSSVETVSHLSLSLTEKNIFRSSPTIMSHRTLMTRVLSSEQVVVPTSKDLFVHDSGSVQDQGVRRTTTTPVSVTVNCQSGATPLTYTGSVNRFTSSETGGRTLGPSTLRLLRPPADTSTCRETALDRWVSGLACNTSSFTTSSFEVGGRDFYVSLFTLETWSHSPRLSSVPL